MKLAKRTFVYCRGTIGEYLVKTQLHNNFFRNVLTQLFISCK